VATKVSTIARAVKLLTKDPFMSVDDFTKKMKVNKTYAYILRSKARALIPKADIEVAVEGTENTLPPEAEVTFIPAFLRENLPQDQVNHPPHYTAGGIETIDFIEAKGLDYNLGNVVKYITRAEHKGDKVKDLQKAQWYLRRALDKACEEYADQSAEEAERLGIPARW
jgi:hypothetical protein